jgi:proteasome lid subunit RPN8/RPN11
VLGYYHSHPNSRAEPSADDRAQASGDSRIWAIVAAGGVTWWRDGKDCFEPLPTRFIEG